MRLIKDCQITSNTNVYNAIKYLAIQTSIRPVEIVQLLTTKYQVNLRHKVHAYFPSSFKLITMQYHNNALSRNEKPRTGQARAE